jgi:hypothetical protein
METFLKPLAELINPPWSYILGIGFLIMIVAPHIVELRAEFLDARMGRRRLELEKLRLEILKLRLELGELSERKEPTELKAEDQGIPIVLPQEASTSKRPTPERPTKIREWLKQHPRFARPVLLSLQIVLGFMVVVNAVGMVAVPISLWSEKDMGPVPLLVLAFVYGAIAWASYKGFMASRSIRRELNAR